MNYRTDLKIMAENGHTENGAAAAEKRKAEDDTENGENGANGAKREKLEGGTLLFAGATDWKLVGRKAGELSKSTNTQWSPTRLAALKDVKIVSVSKNCASANCFAIDEEGQVWAWGRNEAGQLGLGDTEDRFLPTTSHASLDYNGNEIKD